MEKSNFEEINEKKILELIKDDKVLDRALGS